MKEIENHYAGDTALHAFIKTMDRCKDPHQALEMLKFLFSTVQIGNDNLSSLFRILWEYDIELNLFDVFSYLHSLNKGFKEAVLKVENQDHGSDTYVFNFKLERLKLLHEVLNIDVNKNFTCQQRCEQFIDEKIQKSYRW